MRRRASTSSASRPSMTVDELEKIFVNKLSEKYQLTDRDLQRAFKRFDRDGNGYLNLQELTDAIRLFLNGIDDSLVAELAHVYDVDGDGQISVVEFTSNLLTRSSNPTAIPPRVQSSTRQYETRGDQEAGSTTAAIQTRPSREDTNPMIYQAKIFLQNMKAILCSKANALIKADQIPLRRRLMSHHDELVEQLAQEILIKEFQPSSSKAKAPSANLMNQSLFNSIMKKYTYPGAAPPDDSLLRYLFQSCCPASEPASSKCDVRLLNDLLFAKSGSEVNRFGFVQPVVAATDLQRPEVSSGPISIKAVDGQRDIKQIPRRMLTKQSHTGLAVPSDFAVSHIQRSSAPPNISFAREHVIGMTTKPLSGTAFKTIMGQDGRTHMLYAVGRILVIYEVDRQDQQQIYLEAHSNDVSCFTLSYDQQYIASGQLISKDSAILLWENPLLSSSHQSAVPMMRLGQGFLAKGSSAVAMSPDNSYVCGIGNDDKHTLGIWSTSSQDLIFSTSSATGIPPQILSLSYCPNFQHTSFICKNHQAAAQSHDCDLIVTAGHRHLKFWSFQRPSKSVRIDLAEQLQSRTYSMGTIRGIDAPKIFTTVDYLLSSDGRVEITLVGGDNGAIYSFRGNVCVAANLIIQKDHGGINQVIIVASAGNGGGALAYVAGGGASVVIVDATTLSILRSFSTSLAQPSTIANSNPITQTRPTSGSRPRSAPAVRRMSSGTGMQAVTVAGAPSSRSDVRGTRRIVVKDNIKSLGEVIKSVPIDGVASSNEVLCIGLRYTVHQQQVASIIALSASGKLISINSADAGINPITNMHYGPLYGLAVSRHEAYSHMNIFASGGDDRWLSIWSANSKELIVRARARNAIRAIDFSSMVHHNHAGSYLQHTTCVAVGSTYGYLTIFTLSLTNPKFQSKRALGEDGRKEVKAVSLGTSSYGVYELTTICTVRDCIKEISDVKYNADSTHLAVASHDCVVYM
jgi:WD40 repeat protein